MNTIEWAFGAAVASAQLVKEYESEPGHVEHDRIEGTGLELAAGALSAMLTR